MLTPEYNTAIIGAGPAGLFAAYESTVVDGPGASIALIDKGGSLDHRTCPYVQRDGCRCANCSVSEGLMGAGLFSDGKLHLHPEIIEVAKSGIITPEETGELLDYTERLFEQWGLDGPVYPLSNDASAQLAQSVQGMNLGGGFELQVKKRTRHVGSDMLPALVGRMLTQIHTQGDVDVRLRSRMLDVDPGNGALMLTVRSGGETHRISASRVIMGLGRRGSYQLQDIIDKFSVPYTYQPIRIGGRVELPHEVMRRITDINYNPCFRQKEGDGPATFTFCANPQGFLTVEALVDQIPGINGESKAREKTPFTNFAVLTELPVPPGVNPNAALRDFLYDNFNSPVPLVQTTADFVAGTTRDERRPHNSTVEHLQYANIARIFPPQVAKEIGEFLLKIDAVCPGVVGHDALFVAPEAKVSGIEVVPQNKGLETNVPGLHLIGDASGLSRNIVAAAITGILAARRDGSTAH